MSNVSLSDLPDDIRASHRDLSPVAERYLDFLARHPEWNKPVDELIDLPHEQKIYPLETWPTFISRERYAEMGQASVRFLDLLRSLPERLVGNGEVGNGEDRVERLVELWDLPDEQTARQILDPPDGYADCTARMDLIRAADDSWKFLEANVSASLGGSEMEQLGKLYQDQPLVRDFVQQEGLELGLIDTLSRFDDHLLSHAHRYLAYSGDEDPNEFNLAMTGLLARSIPNIEEITPQLQEDLKRQLAEFGPERHGNHLFCLQEEDVEERDGRLYGPDGQRLHMVIRFPTYDMPQSFDRAYRARRLYLVGGPSNNLLSDRRNFGLLSEAADAGEIFSEEERAFIQRHVPWSRKVRRGTTSWRGEMVDLPELFEREREKLLVKPFIGYGGQEVHAGWSTEPARWRELLEAALDSGNVLVQEFVPSRRYVFQHGDISEQETGAGSYRMVWGAFVFGKQPGGMVLRMVPEVIDDGVVNVTKGALRGLAFLV